MSREEYERIKPGYYYTVMRTGSKLQQFWHSAKFNQIKSCIQTKGAKILDIGSGPGCFLSLIQKDFRLAVGFDISFNQLSFAKEHVSQTSWVVGDALKLPFKANSFDCIILSEVIEHLPQESSASVLKSIHSLLAPNGRLVLTTPNYHSLWPLLEFGWNFVNPIKYLEQHINKYTVNSLKRAILGAGFSEIIISASFVVSPFVALFSKSAAEKIYAIEQKCLPRFGSIMIAEIRK